MKTLPTQIIHNGESMGFAHRTLPVYGVQFHPESILTQHGKQMLKNFLDN